MKICQAISQTKANIPIAKIKTVTSNFKMKVKKRQAKMAPKVRGLLLLKANTILQKLLKFILKMNKTMKINERKSTMERESSLKKCKTGHSFL